VFEYEGHIVHFVHMIFILIYIRIVDIGIISVSLCNSSKLFLKRAKDIQYG